VAHEGAVHVAELAALVGLFEHGEPCIGGSPVQRYALRGDLRIVYQSTNRQRVAEESDETLA